jgi:hypothetical protein
MVKSGHDAQDARTDGRRLGFREKEPMLRNTPRQGPRRAAESIVTLLEILI